MDQAQAVKAAIANMQATHQAAQPANLISEMQARSEQQQQFIKAAVGATPSDQTSTSTETAE